MSMAECKTAVKFSIASTLESLQSYTKPSMWSYIYLEYSIDTGVINVHY